MASFWLQNVSQLGAIRSGSNQTSDPEINYNLPNILILKTLGYHRLFFTVKPELTVGYHSGFYSIDHAQDPDSGAQSVVFPLVHVSAEQMERAVGRVQRLPVVVVEFDIQNTWKSEIR